MVKGHQEIFTASLQPEIIGTNGLAGVDKK